MADSRSGGPRIRIRTIDHIGLPVADRKRAMRFHRDVLGLTVIPHQIDGNTLAWTEMTDGTMVHLIDPPQTAGRDKRQHVAFEVSDLDEALAVLAERGIELEAEPGVRQDGQRYLFVYDPDGNRIELATRGDHSETGRLVDEDGYTNDPAEASAAGRPEERRPPPGHTVARMRLKTINHVGLPITDRRQSLPFYRDVLGLEIIPSMETGDSLIWMQTADGTMAHIIEGAPIPHAAFEVEDFDGSLAAVKAAGIEIIKGPLERMDGQRAFYCFDPDGNRLEFTTAGGLKEPPAKRVVDEWGRTTSLPGEH